LKIQKTGNLKEDVIISFLHSMCVLRFFNNIIFSKNFNKRKFYLFFFGGGSFGERGSRRKGEKNSKKCKEIILHPSEFFTMEIKVQFWIRYQ